MPKKTPVTAYRLAVADLADECAPEVRALFDKFASRDPLSMERLGTYRGPHGICVRGLRLHDWRNVGVRYLRRFARRFNLNIWIYRGGRHLAVHVARPVVDDFGNEVSVDSAHNPDPCLARIIEL